MKNHSGKPIASVSWIPSNDQVFLFKRSIKTWEISWLILEILQIIGIVLCFCMLGLDPFFPAWAVVPRGAGECGSYEFPICATVKVVAYKIGDGRCLPPEK